MTLVAYVKICASYSSLFLGHVVELHYVSLNESAVISKLISILDKGKVTKKNPRWIDPLNLLPLYT